MFLIAAAPSLAQSPATDPAPTTVGINYFDFFVLKGGPIALALIVLSVITVALAFEHELQNIVNLVESQALQTGVGKASEAKGLAALIQRRISVLVSRLEDISGRDEAREARTNVLGFFALLLEWSARADASPSNPSKGSRP